MITSATPTQKPLTPSATPPKPLMNTGELPIPPYTPPDPSKPENPQSLAPTTTAQEDVVVARQNQISLIWEVSQAAIALLITMAVIYTAITKIVSQELTNAFFLIVGFYFSRTNHEKIGGGGIKANEGVTYKGR